MKSSRRTLNIGSSFFLFNWFFVWVFRLIWLCRSCTDIKQLRFRLPSDVFSARNGQLLGQAWNKEKERAVPSVLNALAAVYKKHFLLLGLWKVLWAVFTWLGTSYFLFQFIATLRLDEPSIDSLHGWAAGILFTCLFSSICIHQLYSQCAIEGYRVKGALTDLVYRKALVLARVKGGAGEVINIVSTDINRIQDAVLNFHFFWTSISETILILSISVYLLNVSALSSIAIVVLLIPIQVYLGWITSNLQRDTTEITTKRVHIMSELLTAIKLIKFYAWEAPFSDKITEIRKQEVHLLRRALRVKAVNFTLVFAAPVVIAIVGLTIERYRTGSLGSSLSFTALAVFNTLRYPFLMLPQSVKSMTGARVSISRLSAYLRLPEVVPIPILSHTLDATANICSNPSTPVLDPKNKMLAFKIEDASFTWEGESVPSLFNISVDLHLGEILAVIGDVGSGKSSLVAALLGQIRQTSGETIKIYGTTSYVPQEAWLLNFTLKENILFGADYDLKKYSQVIRVCALERDISLLAAGDDTEIAERGANLSGGQRQRASLARAVYNDADIVLLDDPLSAVDQAVGRHIFNECIKTHLKSKAVVMVTHQLQYLESVDKILQLKNGRVYRYGTFTELMKNDAGFADLINNHVSGGEAGEEDAEAVPLKPTVNDHISIAPEDPNGLNVELKETTVKAYKNLKVNEETLSSMLELNQLAVVKNAGKSHDIASVIMRNELTVHSINDLASSIAGTDLQSDIDLDPAELVQHLLATQNVANQVSDQLNSNENLLNAPQEEKKGQLVTEDTSSQSLGWRNYILYARYNRGVLFFVFMVCFFFFVHVIRAVSDVWLRFWISKTISLSDEAYILIYAGFILFFTLGILTRGLMFASEAAGKAEELHQRMFERVLRAPMAFFDATPLGRILSAFSKHQFHVDETMPDSLLQALQYIPLTIGAIIVTSIFAEWSFTTTIGLFFVGILGVFWATPAENKLKSAEAATKPPVFSHLAATLEGLFSIRAYGVQERFSRLNCEKLDQNHELGLSLAMLKSWTALYLDLLTSIVIYCATLFIIFRIGYLGTYGEKPSDRASKAGLAVSNVLQILVFLQWSVRMLGEVQEQISSVGVITYYSTKIKQEAPARIKETEPPETWPQEGVIEFKDVVLKYHDFGVAVLKNISFTINSKEKIGIVGRTGSGKSTLLVSLLRIVELTEGKIIVDGIDISKIGLCDLREKVAIIPQEPVLFVGTIRSNLDPFNRSSDDEIWKALASVHLDVAINAMPVKLDSPVIENGKNFSLGQRQLFCIARAILSKTKILVLDEATAAIDMQTDALIQTAIKKNFADLTVLTIAHRLNTIIESDKVLVMEAGRIVEFDTPIALLDRPNGHFATLVKNTGEATARKLRELAQTSIKGV